MFPAGTERKHWQKGNFLEEPKQMVIKNFMLILILVMSFMSRDDFI